MYKYRGQKRRESAVHSESLAERHRGPGFESAHERTGFKANSNCSRCWQRYMITRAQHNRVCIATMRRSSFSAICLAATWLLMFNSDVATARRSAPTMGINYGRLGDDLPSPDQAVALIKSLGFGQVKIFDSDPQVLTALANSGLRVVMGATNEELESLATSPAAADDWVNQRVQPHFPATRIRMITVGNEVLSHPELQQSWPHLVPAMQNIQSALENRGLHRYIKVTSCIAMDALNVSYPPSAATFRADLADDFLRPLLGLVSKTDSYLFLNAYPYFAWSANSNEIALEYALFETETPSVADGEFEYSDLLDAQLDSFAAAMEALGFPHVKIAISETGWPTMGGPDELGASVANAAVYNGRLVKKMLSSPPKGTPRRPGLFIPTFIFALFNEDQKTGPVTERNWGLLYPNSSHVYSIGLPRRIH
eukprot:Gb_13662 [translate_table: standard]